MPRGSAPCERRGGRQKGTLNKRTAEMLAEIEAGGEMPLAYMLRVMRDDSVPKAGRMEAAARAAPYCHAKLATVELTAAVQVEHRSISRCLMLRSGSSFEPCLSGDVDQCRYDWRTTWVCLVYQCPKRISRTLHRPSLTCIV